MERWKDGKIGRGVKCLAMRNRSFTFTLQQAVELFRLMAMNKTLLTVSVTSLSSLGKIAEAVEAGVGLIEIRLDHLARSDVATLVRGSPRPMIWTLRHTSEGGQFDGSIDEQIDRLIEALDAGGEFVDLEFQRWKAAKEAGQRLIDKIAALRAAGREVRLILSWHDFQGTPDDLEQRVGQMAEEPYADIVKFACGARTIFDNFRVFDILHNAVKPTIGIAMGATGSVSRVLAGKFGGFLTFAAMDEIHSSAPGQLTVEQMKAEYGLERINRATKLAGIVGHPVGHSLSPIIHNRAYQAMGLDGVYVKFDVPERYEDFCRFIDEVRRREWFDLMGLSVTIPHKTHALRYLKSLGAKIDPLAVKIGAVNTIVFGTGGELWGYNTDYLGVLETLRQQADLPAEKLVGKRTAVFGSGGVARAIVAAMMSVGAEVTVFNRTESKAAALAEEFGCRWASWNDREQFDAQIMINGTSLGMWPEVESCPLRRAEAICPECVVFDTVYNPLETKLLRLARSRGAVAIHGADMLVYQAVEQIKLWKPQQGDKEISIPADIMRTVVLSKLSN
ncbi:MAG: shikimate dehydrogenase, partial [Phycisphaerae bacterium]|nr:shikimate dehydrogenase [Phycisphaerae bacterium]